MTLKAGFNLDQIKSFVNTRLANFNSAILQTYQFAGEEFVRNARIKTAADGGFNDITGNLRSSIGYIILQNGKQIYQNFEEAPIGTDRETGKAQGLIYAIELASTYSKGIVLICVAGMDYAAAVESKGKDVITGSSLETETRLKQLLGQL